MTFWTASEETASSQDCFSRFLFILANREAEMNHLTNTRARLVLAATLLIVEAQSAYTQLSVSKSSITFGSFVLPGSKTDSFYVKNSTQIGYALEGITTSTPRFTASGSLGIVADSVKIRVTFAPDGVGVFADTVIVANSAGASLKIILSGSGLSGIVLASPRTGATLAMLTMADTFATATRVDSFTIRNISTSAMTVSAILAKTSLFRVLNTLPFTVNASDSQRVRISHTGTRVHHDFDTLVVTHNHPTKNSSPLRLTLSAWSISRLMLGLLTSYTRIRTYDSEDTLRVTAASTGTAAGLLDPKVPIDSGKVALCGIWNPVDTVTVVVDSITFTGPHFRNTTPTPYIHASAFDRNINFVYQPKDLSSLHRDTLVVWTKDNIPSGNRLTLLVEGASRRAVHVQTTGGQSILNFGSVPLGVSLDNVVRILNYQDISLRIDSVRLAAKNPKYRIPTPVTGLTLNRGDTTLVTLRFTASDTLPNLASSINDTLVVYTNFQPGPFKLPLTAKVISSIVFSPASIDSIGFGTIPVNLFKDSTLKLYNRTGNAYRIDSISMYSGKTFYLLSNSLVTQLKGGDSTAIQVRYNPKEAGLAIDTMKIWHNFTALGKASPYKVVLTGIGSTNAIIPPGNYITVDNVRGPDGFAVAAPDSSYVETTVNGFYQWNSAAAYGGAATGYRRSPRVSGSPNGSSARWTFKVDSTSPYLIYHYVAWSTQHGQQLYVHLRKFGVGGIVDSIRFDERQQNANYYPEGGGSWYPLMMHRIDGVGPNAASITIGADARTSAFLQLDAVRCLRSTQKADLEFGRRSMNFSPIRIPEEFPQITLGDEYVRQYRLYNLGRDTLVIGDISFYPTITPVAWFYVKNFTPGSALKIPPMILDQTGKETGGYFDLQLAFQPYQEGSARDSMVISSNDENEPKAYIILYGDGVNYNFIMNASEGNTELHYNAPGPPDVPVIPFYRETANGSWINSTAGAATFPIANANVSSRVNVGDVSTLPHKAWYDFQLPELYHGRISTAGRYILEYGGPFPSSNAYTNTIVKVTHASLGVPPDSVYFNSRTNPGAPWWFQIGGTAKTFFLSPGSPITVEFRRDTQTEEGAVGGGPNNFLRTDLLRIRKVPTGALIGVDVPQRTVVNFGDVSFRAPGGIDGRANLKTISLASIGESQIVVNSIRLRIGQYYRLVNPPSTQLYMRALTGTQPLTVAFTPDRISPRFVDTLEVLSNSTRDSVLRIPLSGNGIGGIYTVDDDGSAQEVYSTPTFGGLYINGWNKASMTRWQIETSNTADSIGRGRTRRLLPIYFNPNARFEWYPAIPLSPKDSTRVLMNVAVSIPRGYTKGSPAARYRVFSTGGNITKDTVVNQNSAMTTGASNLIEINLGNHYFLRDGRDVAGGQAFFGHVQLFNDTAEVTKYYGTTTNFARRDTFGLIADAVILRELDMLNPLITSANSEVPLQFSLSQNYPNPFNPATTVEFTIAKQVPVKLQIYDVLGREVALLMQTSASSPGKYIIRWDGRNRLGQSVATGIYFYRVVAGDFVQTKKMIVLK